MYPELVTGSPSSGVASLRPRLRGELSMVYFMCICRFVMDSKDRGNLEFHNGVLGSPCVGDFSL